MAVRKDILLDAIESAFSLLPEVPGKIEYLTNPAVRIREATIDDLTAAWLYRNLWPGNVCLDAGI